MKLLGIVLFSMLFVVSAFANEKKICVITSDIDSEKTDLFLDFQANGDIDSIRLYKTITGGQIVSNDSHPVEKVIQDGVVASERKNRDVVILKTDRNFSPVHGGFIIVDYLFSGVTGTRKLYKLKLTRVLNQFELTTLEGKKVSKMVFLGNRAPVVGVVGIKEVVVHP